MVWLVAKALSHCLILFSHIDHSPYYIVGIYARICLATSGLGIPHQFQKDNWRKFQTRYLAVGDLVVLQEDGLVLSMWQLAQVKEVHAECDGIVHVESVKTCNGT